MAKFVVLLGPPGAGKGTQAQLVAERFQMPHISSGDIFRENLKGQTELGKVAEGYMNRGELVPDDVTIGMIKERLSRPDCANGALLDGFPRTPAQADALEAMLGQIGGRLVCSPYIRVPDEVLIERLQDRWTCRSAGHVFHAKNNPPKTPGVCDFDGSELFQREDDMPETVRRRIKVYMEQTSPLISYYQKAGKLEEIDGTQPIEQVTDQLVRVIEKRLLG
jgi:adenylate kinase